LRSDRDRLEDILEAIERIERHTFAGREVFDSDELVQTWVVHHLEIIGEACSRVSAEFRERHPDVPWRGYTGMRNILAHQYFGIDLEPVWLAATEELDSLKSAIRAMRAGVDKDEPPLPS